MSSCPRTRNPMIAVCSSSMNTVQAGVAVMKAATPRNTGTYATTAARVSQPTTGQNGKPGK
ncbi:hypothetical protein Kisp01_26940 [Kineosporia sp. NBRC 101677]|nr:hypothetical protein Kisp01_26940 [Kineosporia sp. NBRC 101677]